MCVCVCAHIITYNRSGPVSQVKDRVKGGGGLYFSLQPQEVHGCTLMVVPAAPYTRRTRHAASLTQSRAWRLQSCSEGYVGMKLSKEVANVGVTVQVQQRLNGLHGTPVHDFL